jgi:4-hydroxy-tetrahydrodipicolinate synthase
VKEEEGRFSGVIPILATPFHDDESLDLDSLRRLVRFNTAAGVDGVTVLGLLGEANRLTDTERARVISAALEAAGDLPVIVGTSHSGTAATIEHSRQATDLGAAAVMLTPPALPVPSEKIVVEYYQRVADRLPCPIILQDHPAISQVHMSVDLILRLVETVPAIAAIKAEAVPSPQRIAALKAEMTPGRRVSILTGLGGLYGIFDLERGSDGFNTGFAFPEVLCEIVRSVDRGDLAHAKRIYGKFLPLIVFEQQPGVAVRKEILRKRSLLSSNRVRHPGASIDPGSAAQLQELLESTFPGEDISRPQRITAD